MNDDKKDSIKGRDVEAENEEYCLIISRRKAVIHRFSSRCEKMVS